jgi:hypothetical protein
MRSALKLENYIGDHIQEYSRRHSLWVNIAEIHVNFLFVLNIEIIVIDQSLYSEQSHHNTSTFLKNVETSKELRYMLR